MDVKYSPQLKAYFEFTFTPLNDVVNFGDIVSSGVARICCEEGQRWKLCHGALAMDFAAVRSSCSMTNSFVTNAVLIEKAVSC